MGSVVENSQVVYLVEEQANPSSDYFLLPALSAAGLKLVRCHFSQLPAPAELDNAWVIFVRYVPPAWARRVSSLRKRLAGLIFFMDDDVLDMRASVGMPLRYRFKLARLAAWKKRWLQQNDAALWVSTLYLQQKYADWHPRLLLPAPLTVDRDVCRVFYHGSASHGAEIEWLRPVMADVLHHDSRIVFEIVGGQAVYRLFRGLPRVTVVHPMKWPAYQAFLSQPGRHIGLAPLHDLPFNRARSYTKFFDITRSGAVGIYSPGSASAEVVTDGEDGRVVALDGAAWRDAILQLASDGPLRHSMLTNAENRLQALAAQAAELHLWRC